MRRWPVFFAILVVALACSRRSEKASHPPRSTPGFLDRVWTVVESPGGSGDLYVFLSDGTFIRAAKEAAPDIGKWSWDGKQLSLLWVANPYTADIDSLTDSYFKLTFHFMDRSFEVGLVPATTSMPDTTRPVEFEPSQAMVDASGHNPAWLFSIENDHAMFRTAKYRTLDYEGAWEAEEPHVWVWEGERKGPTGTEHISLNLRESACTAEAGVQVPFTALLVRGEESWTGCAVVGKLPEVSPDSTR